MTYYYNYISLRLFLKISLATLLPLAKTPLVSAELLRLGKSRPHIHRVGKRKFWWELPIKLALDSTLLKCSRSGLVWT